MARGRHKLKKTYRVIAEFGFRLFLMVRYKWLFGFKKWKGCFLFVVANLFLNYCFEIWN